MDGSITRITLSDGSSRYRARHRDLSGRQHEKWFARKVDAQRWLDEATAAMVTQTWTAPERGRVTVAEWADQWLSAQTQVKPSRKYRYQGLLRTHVLPAWGSHRLADVSHAEVARWVSELRANGSAPATVRQAHPRLRAAARARSPGRAHPTEPGRQGAAPPRDPRRAAVPETGGGGATGRSGRRRW